jgi:hypothetical protein
MATFACAIGLPAGSTTMPATGAPWSSGTVRSTVICGSSVFTHTFTGGRSTARTTMRSRPRSIARSRATPVASVCASRDVVLTSAFAIGARVVASTTRTTSVAPRTSFSVTGSLALHSDASSSQ